MSLGGAEGFGPPGFGFASSVAGGFRSFLAVFMFWSPFTGGVTHAFVRSRLGTTSRD